MVNYRKLILSNTESLQICCYKQKQCTHGTQRQSMMSETNLACTMSSCHKKKIKTIQKKRWTKLMTEVLLQSSTYFKMTTWPTEWKLKFNSGFGRYGEI